MNQSGRIPVGGAGVVRHGDEGAAHAQGTRPHADLEELGGVLVYGRRGAAEARSSTATAARETRGAAAGSGERRAFRRGTAPGLLCPAPGRGVQGWESRSSTRSCISRQPMYSSMRVLSSFLMSVKAQATSNSLTAGCVQASVRRPRCRRPPGSSCPCGRRTAAARSDPPWSGVRHGTNDTTDAAAGYVHALRGHRPLGVGLLIARSTCSASLESIRGALPPLLHCLFRHVNPPHRPHGVSTGDGPGTPIAHKYTATAGEFHPHGKAPREGGAATVSGTSVPGPGGTGPSKPASSRPFRFEVGPGPSGNRSMGDHRRTHIKLTQR